MCLCWVARDGGGCGYIGEDRCRRRAAHAVGLWLVCMDRRVVYGYVRGREELQARGVRGMEVVMGCNGLFQSAWGSGQRGVGVLA